MMKDEKVEPIRVLHVLYVMNYAGTETLLMSIYRNTDRSRIQFDFAVCSDQSGDYDKEIVDLGGRIIKYPKYTVTNHLSYKKWWEDFFRNHKEYRIVHGHIGSTAALYLSVAKQSGCYTIAHSHATNNIKFNLKDLVYSVYSYRTRFIADFFFGCSMAALKDRYGARIAKNTNRSRVFLNAIDVDRFIFDQETRNRVRKEFGISQDEIVFGTVGRLTASKNPYLILNILLELKNRGRDFLFLWFGRGELEDQIRAKINEMGLEDNIIMGGVRNDINRILQAMDAFVFPSVFEGLGITCVEAQAADLVCFCSSNIPQEARITERFIALPIDDTDAWINSIQSFLNAGKRKRANRSEEIKKAGYDINSQSNWLTDFYIDINEDKLCQ